MNGKYQQNQPLAPRASFLNRILFWQCFTVLFLGASLTQATTEPSSTTIGLPNKTPGRIKFAKLKVDFGRVKRGQQLRHAFAFTNVGKGELSIQGIHSSCGCTVVNHDSEKAYAPGESGILEVTLDTSRFSGKIIKLVEVMTNERLDPVRSLVLSAKVEAEFTVDPPLVDFGEVESPSDNISTIRLQPVNAFALKVEDVEYDKTRYDIILNSQPNHQWNIDVKLKPDLTAGDLYDYITVKNNSEALPRLKILVRATITGAVHHEPKYLEFGAIERNKLMTRVIELKSKSKFAVKTTSAELFLNSSKIANPMEYLEFKPVVDDDNHKRINIVLKNATKTAGSVHGRVKLATTDPLQESVDVDFYAFFH